MKTFVSMKACLTLLLCLALVAVWVGPLAPGKASAAGANLIAGKSYASSLAADAAYPDSGGAELTDGITASPLLADSAWQGRLTPGSYSFTVDLGAAQSFQRFEAGFYKYGGAGIPAPSGVAYSYSTDGATYAAACTVGEQGAGSDIVRLVYGCEADEPILARYVQMTVTGTPGSWSFVDEWRVLEPEPVASGALILNGSFLQPQLGDQWSAAEWADEFQYMKDVGMDHLILQWSANTEYGTAVYPTTVPGLTQETSQDVIAKALQMGEVYGIDIYIGLQLNHEWFANYTNDVAWLEDEAAVAGELIEDLWDQYGSSDAFKGWYLSFEVDNWNMPDATSWQRMADFYNDVTAVAHTVSPGLPIMISPFYNVSGGLNPAGWQTMWEYILSRTDIDILALQDGVGAGHAETADLVAWFAATSQAIGTASPGTALWADTETFNTDFKPMDVRHMVDNMLAVEPYVSHYTSFSFNHYMSPQTVNPLYYETYADYVASGILDAAPPSVPAALTATAADPITVHLDWSGSTDDTGVVGYHIYRDGELVYASDTAAASYIDRQLTPSTSYTYAVRAYDAAGNLSALTAAVNVTTPAGAFYPNIWSAGKSYTASMAADAAYPDTGGTKLTDGVYGSASYIDGAWQGRNTGSSYSFILDLGAARPLQELNASFLQVKSVYVLLPKEVRFSVSDDNISFVEAGSVERPAVGSSDQAKTYRLSGLIGVSGRYVKVEVVPSSSAWTFIDEIQARS